MNHLDFNRKLKSMAPDLELIFNPQKRLWGVYQLRSRHFVNAWNAPIDTKPWLLFDITDDRGNFRVFDQRDLARAAQSIYSAHQLWDKGGDWYADRLEDQEKARENRRALALKEQTRSVNREVKFLTNTVSMRPRRVAK